MTLAVNLQDAAGLSYDNITTLQAGATLATDLTLFWQDLNIPGLFQEQIQNDHPIANWLAIIAALTENMGTPASIEDVNAAAQYVYRICLMARSLNADGLISNAQATAILDSYNTRLAV